MTETELNLVKTFGFRFKNSKGKARVFYLIGNFMACSKCNNPQEIELMLRDGTVKIREYHLDGCPYFEA